MPSTSKRKPLFYKVLYRKIGAKWAHGPVARNYRWPLPRKRNGRWVPTDWQPKVTRVNICASGYHLVRARSLEDWTDIPLRGERVMIFVAEGRGQWRSANDKTAFASARLLRPVQNYRAFQRLWNKPDPWTFRKQSNVKLDRFLAKKPK